MSHGEGMERSYRRHPRLYKSNGRLDMALKIPANIQNTSLSASNFESQNCSHSNYNATTLI